MSFYLVAAFSFKRRACFIGPQWGPLLVQDLQASPPFSHCSKACAEFCGGGLLWSVCDFTDSICCYVTQISRHTSVSARTFLLSARSRAVMSGAVGGGGGAGGGGSPYLGAAATASCNSAGSPYAAAAGGGAGVAGCLPARVLEHVFSYLELSDLMQCSLVCWHWNNILADENSEVWRSLSSRSLSDEALRSDILCNLPTYKGKVGLTQLLLIIIIHQTRLPL